MVMAFYVLIRSYVLLDCDLAQCYWYIGVWQAAVTAVFSFHLRETHGRDEEEIGLY